MTALVITDVTVIDGTGADAIAGQTIVVDGDRIRSIGPAGATSVPEGARVIDGRGKYVIPGLMDSNVHLVSARTPDTLLEFEGRYHELVLEAAQLTLKYGVTTVFDTWGPAAPTRLTRDRINSGEEIGSRIYFGGNIIGFNGPLAADFFPTANVFEHATTERINAHWEHGTGGHLVYLTPEEVGDIVRQYISDQDVDFIKYGGTDHLVTGSLLFSEAAQRQIVEAGHEAGLTVQAHTSTVESLRIEIEVGCDLLQHPDATIGRVIPQELVTRIAELQLPSSTLLHTDANEAWTAARHDEYSALDAFRPQNHDAFVAAGVKMLLTTDGFAYGERVRNHPRIWASIHYDVPEIPTQLGISHLYWLKAARQRGLSALQTLRAATLSIAEAYHVDADLGSIESGKIADLVVLDADPLADTENYGRIAEVIKAGAIVDRRALPSAVHLAEDLFATR